jgi:protein SCO1/2
MSVKHMKIALSLLAGMVLFGSCQEKKPEVSHREIGSNAALPYFGEADIELVRRDDGAVVADSVYYTIPKFSLINQYGRIVSHHDYEDKIFLVDFFFTECPTICPIMSSQLARLQAKMFQDGFNKDVMILSFSVKPDNDTPEVLKAYGEHLGANFTNWNFATGAADDIYDLAQDGFMLSAFPSDSAEGGIFHTDKITLIDRQMHIRGYYDGTSTKSMDQLYSDLQILLIEQPSNVTTSVK